MRQKTKKRAGPRRTRPGNGACERELEAHQFVNVALHLISVLH